MVWVIIFFINIKIFKNIEDYKLEKKKMEVFFNIFIF